MANRTNLSPQTRRNWLIVAALSLSGIVAVLSGVYFLYLPSGGYQGGRNPLYGVTILFSRDTWDALHTWGGLAMIAGAAVHLALHWAWGGDDGQAHPQSDYIAMPRAVARRKAEHYAQHAGRGQRPDHRRRRASTCSSRRPATAQARRSPGTWSTHGPAW